MPVNDASNEDVNIKIEHANVNNAQRGRAAGNSHGEYVTRK